MRSIRERSGRTACGYLRLPNAATEDAFVQQQKITRIGEPEEIAALAAFVLSPAGRLLQSALIDMDAGATKTI